MTQLATVIDLTNEDESTSKLIYGGKVFEIPQLRNTDGISFDSVPSVSKQSFDNNHIFTDLNSIWDYKNVRFSQKKQNLLLPAWI
jgi:hypothetical protein